MLHVVVCQTIIPTNSRTSAAASHPRIDPCAARVCIMYRLCDIAAGVWDRAGVRCKVTSCGDSAPTSTRTCAPLPPLLLHATAVYATVRVVVDATPMSLCGHHCTLKRSPAAALDGTDCDSVHVLCIICADIAAPGVWDRAGSLQR
jgi:hypothetical protein